MTPTNIAAVHTCRKPREHGNRTSPEEPRWCPPCCGCAERRPIREPLLAASAAACRRPAKHCPRRGSSLRRPPVALAATIRSRSPSSGIMDGPVAEPGHLFRQNARCHTVDRLFRRSVDVEQIYMVRAVERAREVVHQVHRPRVSMRLKDRVNPAIAAVAGGRERCTDFGRMMPVVVDDRDSLLLPALLEAPVNSAQTSPGPRGSHRQRCPAPNRSAIAAVAFLHVVNARDVQVELA